MRAFLCPFILTLVSSFSATAQMATIKSIKEHASRIEKEIQELTIFIARLAPQKENTEFTFKISDFAQLAKVNRINAYKCYDMIKALPSDCIDSREVNRLNERLLELGISYRAHLRTYNEALAAVKTPEARLLLKKQITEENLQIQQNKEALEKVKKEIEKLKQAQPSPDFILGSFAFWAFTFLALGMVLGPVPILVGVILRVVFFSGIVGIGAYHSNNFNQNKSAIEIKANTKSELERKVLNAEISLKQKLDFFNMVNEAALEVEPQKMILP